jgi:putative methyltransferase (TIGR04325 family)
MKYPIWEGVYPNFKEAPIEGPGFGGEEWIQKSLGKIKALRDAAKEKKTVPTVTKYQESLLPVVASIVYNELGRVRILDFGGGMGFTFYQVARGLQRTENFEYHIVEVEEVCKAAYHFFKKEENIFFHSDFPAHIGQVDIVHMGSSLQYIEKWRGALARLCGYIPRYFLFTDLPAGDIPTYASTQRYYHSVIPVWFFNVNEIIEAMFEEGFKLIFKCTYIAKTLDVEQPCPQENFEDKYKLGHACILLFAKEGSK